MLSKVVRSVTLALNSCSHSCSSERDRITAADGAALSTRRDTLKVVSKNGRKKTHKKAKSGKTSSFSRHTT